MSNNVYHLFEEVLVSYSISDISKHLKVSRSNVKRWSDTKNVPFHYYFGLCSLLGREVDYTGLDAKQKDQFYTDGDTASYCYNKARDVISSYTSLDGYTFIEPSVGSGSFYKHLPSGSIGIDVEPAIEGVGIERCDFLSWRPDNNGRFIVIGNPPFGFRGNLALSFINHSTSFADFVCFILPQTFESRGKGSCRNRVRGYNLIHSERIDPGFVFPDGKKVEVQVVFQVWSKHFNVDESRSELPVGCKVMSVSNGGTPATTRNKKMIGRCSFYVPGTCFGLDKMKSYERFEDLPGGKGYGVVIPDGMDVGPIDWEKYSFKATNGSLNTRTDLIVDAINSALGES